MTNRQEILRMYKESKKKALAETVRTLLLGMEKPRKFKLRGEPQKYLSYWSNAMGGRVSEPSHWPVCYFGYEPNIQNIRLRFRIGYAIYSHAGVVQTGEMNELNKKEHRDKTYKESTYEYSLRQTNKALETLQDKGFSLEKVLSQISKGASK